MKRSALANQYAERFNRCELCEHLEGDHWIAFRSRDYRPCVPTDVHHVWTPSRWEDGFANFLHCCATSHAYAKPKSRYVRLACTAAKIQNGTFDRETVKVKWRRDPIDAIHADIDGGLMGVSQDVWEPLWVFVREHF